MSISIDALRAALDYDHSTGVFTWRRASRNGARKQGELAGTTRKSDGYISLNVCGIRNVSGHRAAWAMHYGNWPEGDLDHVNGIRSDNRISNLRLCDDSTNQANRTAPMTNSSGRKGVCWNRKSGAWQAGIKVRGRSIHLGLFGTIEEASEAYQNRARLEFGEFARA